MYRVVSGYKRLRIDFLLDFIHWITLFVAKILPERQSGIRLLPSTELKIDCYHNCKNIFPYSQFVLCNILEITKIYLKILLG